MNFLQRFWNWFKQGKIESWKATDKELNEATRPQDSNRSGSFEDKSQKGETYKGIKVTFPLPGEPK